MPWKELDVVDQRLEFVLRALHEQVPFAELCREHGISRRTGYKFLERFKQEGMAGLQDQSRRPQTSPTQLSEEVVCELIRLKQAHRTWGARKLLEVYQRLHDPEHAPSESSCKRILAKAGLVEHRRRRSSSDSGRLQHRIQPQAPNELWSVDFKGWWYSQDQKRCEPLTVQDGYSRFLLCVWAAPDARSDTVRQQFTALFQQYGLPGTIRSDNGAPFACTRAPLGLSRLSAWWLALGIHLDRNDPGHPEQNGSHERMHRDLAAEVQYGPEAPLAQVQASLEVFRHGYNHQRPHEALGMKTPGELYVPSERKPPGETLHLEYPPGYLVRQVHAKGVIALEGEYIPLTSALAGWQVGLKPCPGERAYQVYFGSLCLGVVDLRSLSFRCAAAKAGTAETPSAQPQAA